MLNVSDIKVGLSVQVEQQLGGWIPGVIAEISRSAANTVLPRYAKNPVLIVDMYFPDGVVGKGIRLLSELRPA